MAPRHRFRFGPYELDARTGDLRKDGHAIRLQEKSLRILVALVENPSELVGRQELQQLLWPSDTFVDFENGLNTAVAKLRQALCDDSDTPRYIETVRGRGYRFLAEVEVTSPKTPDSLPAPSQALPSSAPDSGKSNEPGPETRPAGPSARRFGSKSLLLVTGLIAVLGILMVIGLVARYRRIPTQTETRKIRIAVLPFQNLTGEADQEYVSDGFTEEVITRLGEMNPGQVGVIARTSAMSYKNTQKHIGEIAGELHVDYVLEGSVRKRADGLRVTAQLIRADDETHIWAHDYDPSMSELVQIQGEVAQAVAQEIRVKLAPRSGEVLANLRPTDPESYRSYLKGRFLMAQRSGEGLTQAVDAFQDSIAKDASYAPAYAGLADAYNLLIFYGYPPGHDGIPKARAAATRAIELDPNLASAHVSLAYVYYMWDWKWAEAEQEFQKALQLDPNASTAHHWYAQYLASIGRQKESLEQIHIAEELDPRALIVATAHGYLSYFARDYDAAAAQCAMVLQRNPNFMVAHAVLGLAEEQRHNEAAAIAEFQRALELSGGKAAPYLDYLGHAFAIAGRTNDAEAILKQLDSRVPKETSGPGFRAATLAALGRKQEALEALEEGYIDNDGALIWLKVDPRFDPLRQEPRFAQLLARLTLPRQ